MGTDRLLPEGVRSQFLGPLREWILSHTEEEWVEIHDEFWGMVADLIQEEEGSYDDLPGWMTEDGTQLLEANDPV